MATNQPGKALLFIPDISGFTSFVHNTEIKHSQHIISELLELLIDSNELGLELVEIEGDALFYFKQGDLPDYDGLIKQIKKMFIQFHHHLKLYEKRRICQCGACTSAHNELKLKFVVHYGDIDFINVKGRIKPIGSSVIAVHRLLKNSIPINEYTLVSKDLEVVLGENELKKEGIEGHEQFAELGQLDYRYFSIDNWNQEVPAVPNVVIDGDEKIKPVVREIEIDMKVLDLYEILSNLKYRKAWNEELDELAYDEKDLNQDGTEHTCVIDGNKIQFISRKDDSATDDWVYIEQTTDIPLTKKVSNYFVLKPNGNKTMVKTMVYVEPKNFIAKLLSPLIKNKVGKSVEKALGRLKAFAEGDSFTA